MAERFKPFKAKFLTQFLISLNHRLSSVPCWFWAVPNFPFSLRIWKAVGTHTPDLGKLRGFRKGSIGNKALEFVKANGKPQWKCPREEGLNNSVVEISAAVTKN